MTPFVRRAIYSHLLPLIAERLAAPAPTPTGYCGRIDETTKGPCSDEFESLVQREGESLQGAFGWISGAALDAADLSLRLCPLAIGREGTCRASSNLTLLP